jgi:2-polyprenyl-6-methoxyphenol hydroxylase-like FAD-dependent oxidoreductase
LCAGVALNGIGCDVHVFERASGPMGSRGAGIVVQPDLLDLLKAGGAPPLPATTCTHRQYLTPDGVATLMPAPQAFTSWDAIYNTLRAAFPGERYHHGARLTGFDQAHDAIHGHFEGHGTVTADLLVCADGAKSTARDLIIKPRIVPSYAGYLAWRGTVEEANAPADLVRFFADRFSFCEARSGGHILAYLIPGASAAIEAGKRRINWVWYVNAAEGPVLTDLLTDRTGQLRESSVPPGMMRPEKIAELRAHATTELHSRFLELVEATADPFVQVIQDLAVERMVEKRIILLGDAAFIVRPHTAAATAKAAADATVLAAAILEHSTLSEALAAWEHARLLAGMRLSQYGVRLGGRTTQSN